MFFIVANTLATCVRMRSSNPRKRTVFQCRQSDCLRWGKNVLQRIGKSLLCTWLKRKQTQLFMCSCYRALARKPPLTSKFVQLFLMHFLALITAMVILLSFGILILLLSDNTQNTYSHATESFDILVKHFSCSKKVLYNICKMRF